VPQIKFAKRNIRYVRWISKLAFLLLFTVPLLYVPSGLFPTPYTGINSATTPLTPPSLYLPLAQSPCSIWINGWCNVNPGLWIVEPLGGLQALITSKVSLSLLMPTIIALLVVFAVIVLLGAMFCSWACPIGSIVDSFDSFVGRFLPKIEAKRQKIVDKNLQDALQEAEAKKVNPAVCISCPVTKLVTKNGVVATGILAGSLGAASILGFNAFCLVCPIGIASRGLFHLKATTFATKAVTGKAAVVSSSKFSGLLYAGPFYLELLIFPVIAVLVSLKERRFWCNKLCPVGAIVNLSSTLNPFIKPKMDKQKCIMNHCPEDCKDSRLDYCGACRKEDNYKCIRVCPAQINLLDENVSLHRCTKCMECYIACDHNAIKIKPVAKPDIFRVKSLFKRRKKAEAPKVAA
jgi:ferredoxin-type protein NapH